MKANRRPQNDSLTALAVLGVMGVVTGLATLLLGASYYGLPLFKTYFSSAGLLALNLLPPVLLSLFLYCVIGRAWISHLASSALWIILAAINFFKLAIRGDPFVASDVTYIGEAGNILRAYELPFNWKLIVGALVIAGGTAAVFFLTGRRQRRVPLRVGGAAVLAGLSVLLFCTAYADDGAYEKNVCSYPIDTFSAANGFITHGFSYPFLRSLREVLAPADTGYSDAEARALLYGYATSDIPEERQVNVVSVMLEAFTDLSRFPGVKLARDVYGPFHELQSRSVHGELVDNIFAGGTINTERCFLTGYTEPDEYTENVGSFVWYLRDQGYTAEGVHAGDGWFYERRAINACLGFENYYFLEDYEDSNRTDEFFLGKVTELYEARDRSKPYFSFSVSYQNHGGYYENWTVPEQYVDPGGYTSGCYNILNNYLSGISDTCRRINALADYFEADADPVVLVIFGDHMPWLGNGNWVYHELGINMDVSTPEGFYDYYTTPYIIFANAAARAVLGDGFTGEGGSFSPCFLMPKVFDLCAWQGNRYMAALRDVAHFTDVFHTPTGYYRIGGQLTLAPEPEAFEAIQRFRNIEYYMRRHFEY